MPMTVIYNETGTAVQILRGSLTRQQVLDLLTQYTGYET